MFSKKGLALALLVGAAVSTDASAGNKIKVGGIEVSTSEAGAAVGVGVKSEAAKPEDCAVKVPPNTRVIKGEAVINGSSEPLLVCSGADLVLNAASTSVFILGDADVTINGGDTRVFSSGGSDLVVNGFNTTVFTDHADNVVVTGAQSHLSTCSVVSIDVTALPAGC